MTKDDASNWNCTNGIMVDESDPFKTRLALLTSQRIPKKLHGTMWGVVFWLKVWRIVLSLVQQQDLKALVILF